MAYQESGMYVARKPHVLLRRLAYILMEKLDWIDYDILMSQLTRDREIKQLIIEDTLGFVDNRISKYRRYSEAVISVRNWWERVVSIPKRRIYLVTPLPSKPRTREEPEEILGYFYKDPLAPTMKNTYALKELLERKGVAEDSSYIVLDHLYMPFPIRPEQNIGIEALPSNLQELYHRHVASDEVFDPKTTIQRLSTLKSWKEIEEMENITEDEKHASDPAISGIFEKYLHHCVDIIQAMYYLQLQKFFSEQTTPESIVIACGLNQHLAPFNLIQRLYNERQGIIDNYPNPDIVGIKPEEERSFYVNPLAGVTDQRTKAKIMKHGLADESVLKSLESVLDYAMMVKV